MVNLKVLYFLTTLGDFHLYARLNVFIMSLFVIYLYICDSLFLLVSFILSIHLAFLLYDFLWLHILLQNDFAYSIE